MTSSWKSTACILCSRNCALRVQTEHGHITKIRGDDRNPISAGYLCQKATRLDHYQNHADRLMQPLRRTKEGEFEAISWDLAIAEIAAKLVNLQKDRGADALAYYGGGGQGNHLGGVYASALRKAIGLKNYYSALAQEKTGDFWVNGKLFGRQNCHTTEDIENAACVMFIGTNPWQAHGIRNARSTLQQIAKDPARKMIVIDPRQSETAKLADFHLQLRPGTDAHLLSAMLAIIIENNFEDKQFIEQRTQGFIHIHTALKNIPINDYIAHAGVEADTVYAATKCFANAHSASVRVDLGIQQSLNSTLNSYLEKLLFIITGNLGKKGSNNFHSFFVPIIGHSPSNSRKNTVKKTNITGISEIAGLFPPNVLPAEIDTNHNDRIRGLIVDSANPAVSGADTKAYTRALKKLELLVVIDVTMNETAKYAHYILPAASQFEKWEATFFNLDFPRNGFHLRKPLFEVPSQCLPEPEIYRRLGVAMKAIPTCWPLLSAAARLQKRWPKSSVYRYAIGLTLKLNPKLKPVIPFILQGSLGQTLPKGAAATAVLWGSSHLYVRRHGDAVARTGLTGKGPALAESLFKNIVSGHSGILISEHKYADTWSFIRHADGLIHLDVPEMRLAMKQLWQEKMQEKKHYPLILIAGERRAYNANTIYRDPSWRKGDVKGALRIHPEDAKRFNLIDGAQALCESEWGSLQVHIAVCDSIRPGVVGIPHGYGLEYPGEGGDRITHGPLINTITGSAHRDPISATPYHKYVPVRLTPSP